MRGWNTDGGRDGRKLSTCKGYKVEVDYGDRGD